MTENFKVVRVHLGDKAYAVGDTREAERTEVAHLIPHVLVPEKDAKTAETNAPQPKPVAKVTTKAAQQ